MAEQTPQSYSRSSYKNFYFFNYRSREELNEKGEKAFSEVGKNYTSKFFDKSFVGCSFEEAQKCDFTKFINEKVLDESIDFFDATLGTIDMGGSFKKQRIIITDDKRGIFDFSLASKGLFRLQEYYSKELAEDSPFEFMHLLPGLVDPDLVVKDKMGQFWYSSTQTNKKYFLTKQQKGTAAIELGIEGAKLEFSTSQKKSYVMFEKKGGKAKMVDLYVGVGGLQNLNSTGMLARSMPVLLAAKVFEQAGIRTRISALRLFEESGVVGLTYPVKDYGEELDFNWIALNCSDTRWFRWNLWKYTSALMKKDKNADSAGYGTTIYGGELLDESFGRYKVWYQEQIEKGNVDPLRINPLLMLTGGLKNPENRNPTLQKDEIIEEFYRIVDTVDFLFADDVSHVVKRIYERMVEKEEKSMYVFKSYCINLLSRAYSYCEKGDYSTPQIEIDRLDEEYENKIYQLTEYIKNNY